MRIRNEYSIETIDILELNYADKKWIQHQNYQFLRTKIMRIRNEYSIKTIDILELDYAD